MNRIHSANLSTELLRERIFNKFNSSTTITMFKNFWMPRNHVRCRFTNPQCGNCMNAEKNMTRFIVDYRYRTLYSIVRF